MKLVSIIIPIYNAEESIRDCLESIVVQDYQRLEVIAIDDGSTDSTPTILDNYKRADSRIKVIRQANAGVSAARNRGIDASSGDYVTFVDCDDVLLPNHIANLVSSIGDVDLAINSYLKCEDKRITSVTSRDVNKPISLNKTLLTTLFRSGLLSPVWNKLFKKSILDRQSIRFDIRHGLGEDASFVFQYLIHSNKKICISGTASYKYTQSSGGTLSTKFVPNFQACIMEEFENFILLYRSLPPLNNEIRPVLRDYLAAMIVSMDNLYIHKAEMTGTDYRRLMKACKTEIEKWVKCYRKEIGLDAIIIWRAWCVTHGLHYVDYYIRVLVKTVLQK